MKKRLLTLSLLLSFSSQLSFAGESRGALLHPSVEPIVGYRVDRDGVLFQLSSGGCTIRSDFSPRTEITDNQVVQVTLMRLKPDNCHPFIPTPFEAHFSFEELGFDRTTHFTIQNPNGIALGWIW